MKGEFTEISLCNKNGERVGALTTLDNAPSLVLTTPDKTNTIGFSFNEFGPYIKLENAEVLALLSCVNNEFTISVFESKTRKAKASISIDKAGKFFITQYDQEGTSAQESFEAYLARLVREIVEGATRS